MEAILEATVRDTFGKNEARRTRRSGQLPAVVYGAASKGATANAIAIAVDPKDLLRILHSESGANTLISLKLGGDGDARVLVKAYQLDPVTHHLLHADFYRVAMDRAIQVTIPIVLKGEPVGVKQQGGLLEFVRREIEIECLPGDIPEHLELDVSELGLHQGIRLRDVATDPTWKAVTELESMLVHVTQPRVDEAAETPEAEAVAETSGEPEVIKKGKKDEAEEPK